MRPLKLTLQAFGPFLSKIEIDFSKLGKGNIYLISGVTGSGKTTIFDAICYALFNTSSGSNRGSSTLRSHFAPDNVESYVEYSFLFNEQEYKVIRYPSYERKKTRGEGVILERSKALLYLPDGKIIEKANEVDSFIEELLGLNVTQFSQIALLAQGEFLKLLNADTQTRADVFRNIFKTSNYAEFQGSLKNKKSEYEKEYDNLSSLILQNIKDVIVLSDELAHLQDKFSQNDCFDSLDEFISLLDKQNNSDNDELSSCAKQVETLDNEIKIAREEYQKINIKINLLNQIVQIKKQIEIKKQDFNKAEVEFKTLKDKRANLEKLALEIKKSDDNHKKVLEIKELISLKDNQDNELKSQKEKLTSLNENVLNVQKNYIQALVNQNFDNNDLINDKEKEFLNFELKVNALSNDYQNSYNNYLKMQAGIIAQTLEDNKPCPVCGALKHPNPARLENENLTKEFVDNLKIKLDESNLLLAKKSNDISILKEKNEALLKLISSLSKKFKIDIPILKTNVKNIDFEDELLNLEEKINFQNDLVKKLEQEFVALQSKIDLISKEIKFDDIDLIIENHKNLVKKYVDEQSEIEKIEKDYQAKSLDLSSSLSNLELLNKQILEYTNIDETKIDTLNNFIEEKAQEIEKIDTFIKQIFSRKSINEKILTSLNSKNKDFIAVSKKYLNYKILSECANGALKGKARLAFEQYIQGYYLDLVLYEANKHLKTMTNGQFQIFRKKEASSMQSKTGLELEVMDFYTYKRRSTKTLSGGESFKAALALALGLSDCVSNFSGAINIEAMFIDEGFGSLDSESLDLAMEVIFNLSSNNRLIGLISHIDDLKLKIQNQIQTYKSDKGSRIEINF